MVRGGSALGGETPLPDPSRRIWRMADQHHPFSIEDLFQYKAITPLSPQNASDLEKIQNLNTDGFNEAEVRAYVIDPIVAILGYKKDSHFKPDLEKKIEFIDQRKFIDYKCTLWEENFWIIEAKRAAAKRKRIAFKYSEFKQALEYAVHPRINAALIVLCDGDLFEVFDREENVAAPLLKFHKEDLVSNFDRFRTLLGPWQVWFFEKRRIVRLIDKVFDREFDLKRLGEFRQTVESRLIGKRAIVLKNYQQSFDAMKDANEKLAVLKSATTEDLVDGYFFLKLSFPEINRISETLVDRCLENPFPVLYKIFPDQLREANDNYYAHALTFLLALHKRTAGSTWNPGWLPVWLCGDRQGDSVIESSIHRLLSNCLTQFAEDEIRKVGLLCYAAIRRILDIMAVTQQEEWTKAEGIYALRRYAGEEMSWEAFVSSPNGVVLGMINAGSIAMTTRFLNSCKDEKEKLQIEIAKAKLRELWKVEQALLAATPQYSKLRGERQISETYPAGCIDVDTDYLGANSVTAYLLQHSG